VLGGAAIGSALGLGLRPVVNLITPGSKRGRTGRVRRQKGRDRGAGRGGPGMGQQDYVLLKL
jgi:hypothetical protein